MLTYTKLYFHPSKFRHNKMMEYIFLSFVNPWKNKAWCLEQFHNWIEHTQILRLVFLFFNGRELMNNKKSPHHILLVIKNRQRKKLLFLFSEIVNFTHFIDLKKIMPHYSEHSFHWWIQSMVELMHRPLARWRAIILFIPRCTGCCKYIADPLYSPN